MHGDASAVEKLCPYLLRGFGAEREILAFRHPFAGWQLVKGTREADEPVEAGALRELAEESGLVGQVALGPQWASRDIVPDQIWHFVPVKADDVPENFDFFTLDDGGQLFSFFWWPLSAAPGPEWHEYFVRVLSEIVFCTSAVGLAELD